VARLVVETLASTSGTEGLQEVRQDNNLAWAAAVTVQVVAASHMMAVEAQHLPWEIVAVEWMMEERERVLLVQWQKGPETAVELQRDPEVVWQRQTGSWMVAPRQRGPETAALMQRGPEMAALMQRGPEMAALMQRGPETAVLMQRGPEGVPRQRRGPGKVASDPCTHPLQRVVGHRTEAPQRPAEAACPAAEAGRRRGARTVHRWRTA
jgi:hypothetical protein